MKTWLKGGLIGMLVFLGIHLIINLLNFIRSLSFALKRFSSSSEGSSVCIGECPSSVGNVIFREISNLTYDITHNLVTLIIVLVGIFLIGSLTFVLFKKIKSSSQMSTWLKGGLIGGIVGILYYITVYLIEGLNSHCGIPHEGPMCGLVTGMANFPSYILRILIPFLFIPIGNFLIGFVIGALIGWIIGKIKSKKQ